MRAGELRDPIHIQRKTGGRDEWNLPLPEGWENITVKPIWANVRHLSGSEAIKGDKETSTVRASVRIRWRKGITAGMRVLHDGMTYDIEGALPGPGRQHVDLVCKLVT
ncbi:MAG: phage head closure protein [Comamonas sp.]|nr:phage head closure protein [Comamonas sp.]